MPAHIICLHILYACTYYMPAFCGFCDLSGKAFGDLCIYAFNFTETSQFVNTLESAFS